jgi:hypothetical protein
MKVIDAPAAALTAPTDKLEGGERESIPLIEAVRLFVHTGSLAEVARTLNVPIYDLKKVSRSETWARELAEMQRAEAAALNVKLTTLLNSTLDGLEDRLTNGDMQVVGGVMRRVPLAASTLARVAEVVFDKRQLVRQLPTAIVEADNKKLEGLARQLRALGAKDVTLLEDEVEEVENVMLPGQERAFRVQ